MIYSLISLSRIVLLYITIHTLKLLLQYLKYSDEVENYTISHFGERLQCSAQILANQRMALV